MRRNVRNRPGQIARIQSGANSSRAVALVPHTLRITPGRRSRPALGAAIGGARRQLLDEPVGKGSATDRRFRSLCRAGRRVHLKVDVLPPNVPRFVDPGPGSCQERDEICGRTQLASCAGIQPGSLAAMRVAWMMWSRSLRVMARVWSRTFDWLRWR